MSSNFAIGIDRGGTNVKTCVIRPDGTLLHEDTFDTADGEQIAVWA